MNHYHWHKQVAQTKTHIYYECECGSRHAGRLAHATVRLGEVDTEWLDGAQRDPQ
jgi:hypothetical protein